MDKSNKNTETMIEQFNADISTFIFLKNMFGYCGIAGCKDRKQGKPGKDSKFDTKFEKNTAVYLSGFCETHSAMVKQKIDEITTEIEKTKDSKEELIEECRWLLEREDE